VQSNLTKFSLVVYNRELVVINDMDTFAHYYCYAKKQKPGLVIPQKAKDVEDDIGDTGIPAIEYGSLNPIIPDDDIL
jgi:hypothetical protein